jgi:MYXO-CTERM domain-containing protein
LLSASSAAASRAPVLNRVVFSPGDPNLVVARASYGILPSHDNGASWSYLCDDALGASVAYSSNDPAVGLTASNAFVVGVAALSTEGLEVSPDVGCSWSCVGGPLAGQAIADIVVRPDKPHVVLALTRTYSASDAGISVYGSQLFQSTDDGAHWAAVGDPIDLNVFVQAIDVSRADAAGHYSIYVSGNRGFGAEATALLLTSTDQGATWTEHALQAFDPTTESSADIVGVDPVDPQRVYLRTRVAETGNQSRLFMTTDGGASFTTQATFTIGSTDLLFTDGLAFALSPDGSKLYAGTVGGGLFVASRTDMVFKKTSPIAVTCLATRGQELWVCSQWASTRVVGPPFVIGVTTDDGAHFTSKLPTLTTLCGPLSCSAATFTSLACNATVSGGQCQSAFDSLCQDYSENSAACGSCASDAGMVADAAGVRGDASSVEPSSSSSSCGCSVTNAGGTGALASASAIAALALGRRRNRRWSLRR